MTPNQLDHLTAILRNRREQLDLSVTEVAQHSGIDRATYWRIETGKIANPRAENLHAISDVLGIPASDLFASAGWVPEKELPTIRPYLRTKYHDLPPDAMQEIEAHFDDIAKKHGISFDPSDGPRDGEDE